MKEPTMCVAVCGLVLLVASGAVVAATANYEVKGPEMNKGFTAYIITSDYQEKPCAVWVLLPDKLDKAKPCKVLYILPPLDRGDNGGILEAKKLGLADKYNIICVNPDFSRMQWYADSDQIPHYKYDSYLPDVIVPFIDKTYPTIAKPEGRILVGFSKSGVGAVSLLLRHPDVFGRAGAWDAPLNQHNRKEYYCTDAYFNANYSIPKLLKEKADIFAGKPARFAFASKGFGGAPPVHQLMDQLKIPHFYDEALVGNHAWTSGWFGPLVDVLMSDDMAKAPLISASVKLK
jgi:hypothetical protein